MYMYVLCTNDVQMWVCIFNSYNLCAVNETVISPNISNHYTPLTAHVIFVYYVVPMYMFSGNYCMFCILNTLYNMFIDEYTEHIICPYLEILQISFIILQ